MTKLSFSRPTAPFHSTGKMWAVNKRGADAREQRIKLRKCSCPWSFEVQFCCPSSRWLAHWEIPLKLVTLDSQERCKIRAQKKIDMHELKLVRKRQEMPLNLILVHHRLDHLPKASHRPWNGKLSTFRRDIPPGRATSKGKVGTRGALKP